MTTIDLTKRYRTRDGRAVTGLRDTEGTTGAYALIGRVSGREHEQFWTSYGKYYAHWEPTRIHDLDLVLAEYQEPEKPVPGLLTPDPLKVEYGAFVAAVKANFAAGTFVTATQSQFDAWLESLTPSLRA